MRSATTFHIPRMFFVALPLVACGSATPVPQPMYTAEQLNTAAQNALPDDSLGPPASSGGGGSSASGDITASDTVPEPVPAAIRVIHASPDRAAASVSLFVDTSEVAAVQALAYRALAGYVELAPEAHTLNVRSAAAHARPTPLATATTPALTDHGRYTAIVHGLVTGTPHLAVTIAEDATTQPDAGKSRLRFFHAIVGLGAVDVCTAPVAARPAQPAAAGHPAQAAQPARPGQAVFANVAYGAFGSVGDTQSAYAEVPSGSPVTLQLRAQNAHACTGLVRGTAIVTPADQRVITTVAIGRVVGAPPVPRQLVVCTEGPSPDPASCATVPIR